MTAIYIAASSRELDRAQQVAAKLADHGFTYPHAWWVAPDTGNDHNLSVEDRARISDRCMDAIDRSDALLLLFPAFTCFSSCFPELGYALCLARRFGMRVIVSGPTAQHIALTDAEPIVRVASDREAIETLVKLSAPRVLFPGDVP